ncbi:MAG: hypothetical protein P0S96_06545 [Simkaniaceae bacterium]|nr:hypothetical protein [Candidatus Sacchlamyda saccharinae]
MKWNILDTGTQSAKANMKLDHDLLENLDQQTQPILHFYDWEGDSATYGHFVNPSDFLNLEEVNNRKLHLAKRPTGGGIVFHIWDFAFSLLVPASHEYFSENTLENYAFVNNAVLAAVSPFISNQPELIVEDAQSQDVSCERFCMARPTKYDVVFNGRKIAGAAQRKTKKGFLHQGTIALKMPDEEFLQSVLLPNTKVMDAMRAQTFPLQLERSAIKEALQSEFTKEHNYVKNSH